MLKQILALDPGETTGFVMAEGGEESYSIITTGALYTHESVLDALVRYKHLAAIVCEVYTTANIRTQAQVSTLELIGAVKGFCYTTGTPFIGQYPAVRRAYLSKADRYVKEHNVPRDIARHATDALAHLLRYATNTGYTLNSQ